MQHSHLFAGLFAALTAVGCGAGRGAARGDDARAGGGAAAPEGASAQGRAATFLGFRLGATLDELRAAEPGLVVARDAAEIDRVVASVPAKLTLHLHQGRLWSVSVEVAPAVATVAAYRSLQETLRSELGAGRATRCESDRGVPIEQDIAQGDGLLQTSWRAQPIDAELDLSRDFGAPGAMRIHGFAADRRLAPPPCGDGETLCGESQRAPRTPPRERSARAGGAPLPGPAALLASPPAATCAAAVAAAPHAELLGMSLGSTRAEVEAVLGRALRDLGGGVLGLDTEVAGVAGQLALHFYGECLAVVMFVVEAPRATPAAYEALRGWARPALGAGATRRCVVEGAGTPPAAGEADRLETRWRGGGPLTGELRFESDDAVPGPGSPARIVFEAEHEALRPFAPHIDFGDR